MSRPLFLFMLIAGLISGATGCESSSSTLLYRDIGDMTWKKKHSSGVPITLDVPTYLKLTVVQQQFLNKNHQLIRDNNIPITAYDVRQEIINTKKIFTVDMKRPAAGTWETELLLDKDKQYFTSIKHKGEDKTIDTIGKQVNDLLKNVVPLIPKSRLQSAGAGPPEAQYTVIESVVRMGTFKLEDIDFEMKVTQFFCEAVHPGGGVVIGQNPAANGPNLVVNGANQDASVRPVIPGVPVSNSSPKK